MREPFSESEMFIFFASTIQSIGTKFKKSHTEGAYLTINSQLIRIFANPYASFRLKFGLSPSSRRKSEDGKHNHDNITINEKYNSL